MEFLYDRKHMDALNERILKAYQYPFSIPATEETTLRILEALCNITNLLQRNVILMEQIARISQESENL